MEQFIFIAAIAAILAGAILWGFKTLPNEDWQILAVMPKKKESHGRYHGLNLTYYGLLCANAYTFAVIIFLVLSAAAHMPVDALAVLVILLLAVCLPSAKIIARLVEKKKATLTVGGAVFAGTLVAPFLVAIVNIIFGYDINVTIFLAAVAIAYAFGEGLGRLACISFGCCYGKPLKDCSPFIQRLFSRFYLVYHGPTKKIAYASGLEGERILPVQVMTAVLYSICGLAGILLYLNGFYTAALMQVLLVTQTWRFVSEFFRADFRGSLSITPYQVMALISLVYAFAVSMIFPSMAVEPVLKKGFDVVWHPGMILMIQSIWAVTFLYTGRSVVTGASLSFHVNKEQI